MINRTPFFLDKDTFMASYVLGSHCVDFNRGNVDNCVRKERSSKFLGMEGRTPLKMQSSSDQVIPRPIPKWHIRFTAPQSSSPISFSYTFSSKFFLQFFHWIFCCLRTNICSTSVCNAQSIRRTATLPILSSAL